MIGLVGGEWISILGVHNLGCLGPQNDIVFVESETAVLCEVFGCVLAEQFSEVIYEVTINDSSC